MRILIGVPSNDTVHAAFAMDLVSLCIYTIQKGHQIAIVNQNSSIIEVGRANMAITAMTMDVDALFTVDSDMRFPVNALVRLANHDRDIVCCDAIQRRPPHASVVKTLDGNPIDHGNTKPMVKLQDGTSAFQLVKKRVLETVKMPHFNVEWKSGTDYKSEDYWFSNQCREAGYDIWCDTELSRYIGHIGCTTHYITLDSSYPIYPT